MDWHNGEPSRRPEGPQQRAIRAVVFYFVETVWKILAVAKEEYRPQERTVRGR